MSDVLCSLHGSLPAVPHAPRPCVWGRPAYLIAAAALSAVAMALAACADLRIMWLVAPLAGFAFGVPPSTLPVYPRGRAPLSARQERVTCALRVCRVCQLSSIRL